MKLSTLLEAQMPLRVLRRVLIFLTIIIAICSFVVHADRVSDKIYTAIQSNHYCSRRLNTTHQMGCTSELGGNLGIVWIVENEIDLNHILKIGPTPPYIAVLGRNTYTRKNLLEFKKHPDRVAGVVFLDRNHEDSKSRSTPFSPEDVCPNRHSGLYVNDSEYGDCKKNVWQKESPISGLLYDDIPYPIFLINEKKSIDDIETCFVRNNIIDEKPKDNNIPTDLPVKKKQSSYPLCGMQLDSFMLAASDSKLCLNSHSLVDELLQSNGRRCYTVENQNIFAYLKPAIGPLHPIEGSNSMIPDMVDPQSIVMVIAKLSSLSMFSEISPGADSTITSIVTLLAVAEALGKVKSLPEVMKSKRNIAFALLDSEPFDYTGSSRMVFNMMENSFPTTHFKSNKPNDTINAIQNMNLTSIDYVINLDQMSNYPGMDSVHFHSDPQNQDKNKLEKVFTIVQRLATSENIKLEREDSELPLPPTPLHEFIKHSRDFKDNKLMGLVLSNYGKTYNNLFYNSIYDDSHNVYQTSKAKLVDHVTQVANLIAKSLYELTFETDKSNNVVVNTGLVEQLFECYLIDAECHLFTKVWQAGQKLPSGPIQTYKDPTKRSDDMNGAITKHLLAYFIGEKVNEYNLTQCYEENDRSLIYNYQYVNGKDEPIKDGSSGVCIKSQVTMLHATSPAFTLTDDGIAIDPKYPAWTISLNGIRNPVRLYLMPSPVYQWCIFIMGVVITVASFMIVHHIRDSINGSTPEAISQTGTST